MKNPFKAIWNFFFPEKKKVVSPKIFVDGIEQVEGKDYVELPPDKIVFKEPKFEDYFNPEDFKAIERQKRAPYFFRIEKNNFISGLDALGMFKNDFRKLALSKGYEARYSGRERFFYLHKVL